MAPLSGEWLEALKDDMEAGRLHTVDDAFQIIRDRMKNEL